MGPIDNVVISSAPINYLNHNDNNIRWHFNPSMQK